MADLPKKPNKPYWQLKTYERQDLCSIFVEQEILEPFYKEGKPLPSPNEGDEMYDKFLERVYAQPDQEP